MAKHILTIGGETFDTETSETSLGEYLFANFVMMPSVDATIVVLKRLSDNHIFNISLNDNPDDPNWMVTDG